MTAVGIFLMGTILALISSGRWFLGGEVSIIEALASFNAVEVSAGGGWEVAKGVPMFFSAIMTAFSWNYPFLSSPWAVFVKIPLWLVSVGVAWALIEVAMGAVQGLIASLRSLI